MAPTTENIIPTLAQGLSNRSLDQLKSLARLLNLDKKLTRKPDIIQAIVTYLLGPRLKALWQNLDQLQQAAIAEAVHVTQGYFNPDQFAAKYGDLPAWYKDERHSHIDPFVFWAEEMMGMRRIGLPRKESDFLDLCFQPISTYSAPRIMPNDLQREFAKFVPVPSPPTLHGSAACPKALYFTQTINDFRKREQRQATKEIPLSQRDTALDAVQDLKTMLRAIQVGKVNVSDKTLMPAKATLNTLADLLHGGDFYADLPHENPDSAPIGPIKAFAWPMLLQASGLVLLEGKSLKLTKAGLQALDVAPQKTLQLLWKKWLKTTSFDELRRIEAIKGQTGKGQRGLTAPRLRREVIAQIISQCPPQQWVTVKDLKNYMIASGQVFLVSRQPENLYISESGYGSLEPYSETWSLLEDVYLKCFVLEYAATLGLVDVAICLPHKAPAEHWRRLWGTDDLSFLSRYDGLAAIRVNDLGAYCLGLTTNYTAPTVTVAQSLRLLPTLDIVMTGGLLTPGASLLLNTFATQTSDVVWKLDRDKTLKAIEAGHALQDFHGFLAQASGEPFPATVEQFFQDCWSRTTAITDLGLVRCLTCTDATLATQIAHDSRTKTLCQLVGDRHLLVSQKHQERFQAALRKLGYTVKFSNS